jgi:patatin-like phospholipase/acyl hydrolase
VNQERLLRDGGVRVLSLDGGGVRGAIKLAILARLEELIGLKILIGQFFDLIVGTSASMCLDKKAPS